MILPILQILQIRTEAYTGTVTRPTSHATVRGELESSPRPSDSEAQASVTVPHGVHPAFLQTGSPRAQRRADGASMQTQGPRGRSPNLQPQAQAAPNVNECQESMKA